MITMLITILGVLYGTKLYAAENVIKKSDLVGTWHQSTEIPWAIQFNEDGTYTTAHTILRLKKIHKDVGRFELKGKSLTVISNDDCDSPCKGLSGRYEVKLIGKRLELIEQEEKCMERSDIYYQIWKKVSR